MMRAIPTAGILSFGYQRSPTHVHQGVDLVAPVGTLVYSPVAGTVRFASERWQQGFSGYGAVVVVSDGSVELLFAHLSRVDVTPGEQVQRGQVLGAVGRTAFTREDHAALLQSGPHLHFEVSPSPYPQDSEAPRLDPVAWLAAAGAHPLEPATDADEIDTGDPEDEPANTMVAAALVAAALAALVVVTMKGGFRGVG